VDDFLNIQSFSNDRFGNESEGCGYLDAVFSDVAIKIPTIKRLILSDDHLSSVILLGFVNCCRDIEELSFRDSSNRLVLNRSDVEALASLPHLKNLRTNCLIDEVAALSRFKGLERLSLGRHSFDLTTILSTIGRSLVCMEFITSSLILETANAIAEYCPNLEILDLGVDECNDELNESFMKSLLGFDLEVEVKEEVVDSLKRGLKKLAKLKVNRSLNKKSSRLGTDWEGYR
jgi:hypothetical protein